MTVTELAAKHGGGPTVNNLDDTWSFPTNAACRRFAEEARQNGYDIWDSLELAGLVGASLVDLVEHSQEHLRVISKALSPVNPEDEALVAAQVQKSYDKIVTKPITKVTR